MLFFFFNVTATTEIYTLSLHDALPIYFTPMSHRPPLPAQWWWWCAVAFLAPSLVLRLVPAGDRSEEHTSELQSLTNLVCRLLLEKKKNHIQNAVIFLSIH